VLAAENLGLRQGRFVLAGVSFTVPTGRYGVLMGRTGSGKTSLLEAVAGLRPVTAGRVLLDGRDVTRLPPAARGVGYVPQDAALFQTLTVRDHLAFALAVRRAPAGQVERRVAELAGWLGLGHLLDRRPAGLSGGEAQRVALGRALSFRPRFLLLDEPLSALDEETREQLVALLDGLRRTGDVTVLHVTHSRSEAERLGDVILTLEDGAVHARPRPAGPGADGACGDIADRQQ
jgi:molybdate/tungstate transport system ATP-binding protein